MKIIRAFSFFVVASAFVSPQAASAETLSDMLRVLSENHAQIRSAEAELSQAKHTVKSTRYSWLPTVTMTAEAGKDNITQGDSVNTDGNTYDMAVKVNQLLWDFGSTNSKISEVKIKERIKRLGVESKKQELISKGAKAYVALYKYYNTFKFAQQSVNNIKKQTGLEEMRVRKGAGISTDVLQAKNQLRFAEVRLASVKGKLENAKVEFLQYFPEMPNSLSDLKKVNVASEGLSIDELTADAVKNSFNLLIADLNVKVSKENEFQTRADGYFPVIDVTADMGWENDTSGGNDYKETESLMVKATLPLSGLGLTTLEKTRAVKSKTMSLRDNYQDTHDKTLSAIRTAWQNYETAKNNVDLLWSQVSIAQAFLDRARKERLLGTRGLLDVLSGETDLINSQSSAQVAEENLNIALINVYLASGRLTPDLFSDGG